MKDWIAEGAAEPTSHAPQVVRLEVAPRNAILTDPLDELQLQVSAFFSDGTSRDVTARACYELSNLIATVEPGGRVARGSFGETTLIVRYLQQQVPVSIAFTAARPDFAWSNPTANNAIDRLVFDKLQSLRMNPSELCDDHVFVRRAYLDATGRGPSADEAKSFVADRAIDKRSRLIDQLLASPAFADFWALKWADVLRIEEKVLDVEAFHGWIRESIASAQPLNEFVQALVTGSTYKNPAANYYRANRDAVTRGETTARLFLGTRLQCAKCHNHPFDRWTQADYYEWSSLFSQLDYEIGENKRQDKLDNNEFAGNQVVLIAKQDEVRNPTTGQIARPRRKRYVSDMGKRRTGKVACWLGDWLNRASSSLPSTFRIALAGGAWAMAVGTRMASTTRGCMTSSTSIICRLPIRRCRRCWTISKSEAC